MADLSTAEANARAANARDPKECVAITAEEACALFDRLRYACSHLAALEAGFANSINENDALRAEVTDLRKRLDILRTAYEVETGRTCKP